MPGPVGDGSQILLLVAALLVDVGVSDEVAQVLLDIRR